jgi:hypothetical protein
MPISHAFTSPKSDGSDATLVRPSNWNATHIITSIGAPFFIAAVDATTEEKIWAVATGGSVCSGASDEAVFNAAYTAGRKNIIGSSGTFHFDADCTPSSGSRTLFQGQGYSNIYLHTGSILIANKDNVEFGLVKLIGTCTATWGALTIYASANHEQFYIHDIWTKIVNPTGQDDFETYVSGTGTVLSDVFYERCYSDTASNFGFINNGTGTPVLKHFRYLNCGVKDAGKDYRDTVYCTGFDFGEPSGMTLIDLKAEGCWVDGAYESCFHIESVVAKQDVVLSHCFATRGGLRGAAAEYGAGFLCTGGQMTLDNCTATANHGGTNLAGASDFAIYGTNNTDVTLINPISYSSTDAGLGIMGMVSTDKVKIIGGRIKTSGTVAMFIRAGYNIDIDGLILDTPVGSSNIGSQIGVDGTTHCHNSRFKLKLVGTCSVTELAIHNADNCVFELDVSMAASYGVYVVDSIDCQFLQPKIVNTGGRGFSLYDSTLNSNIIFQGGYLKTSADGIKSTQCTNLNISGVRIIAASNYAIDITNANNTNPKIIGCDWTGSAGAVLKASPVNPRLKTNITTDGTWYADT